MSDAQFHHLAIAENIATFGGMATVNGQADIPFTVTVHDAEECRGSRDIFSLQLAAGYTNQRLVSGGNIQIHR